MPATGPRTPVWVDRQGVETPLPALERPFGHHIDLSPDGKRIVTYLDQEIQIYDLESRTWTQLTADRSVAEGGFPAWSHRVRQQ